MAQEDQYWRIGLETAFLGRLKTMLSCRMSESYRLELKIPGSQVNQPGATKYRRNMPAAAGARAVKATFHSHTAVAARRENCNMVRLRVPGFALAISTGDPAYRFERSSPNGQINLETLRMASRVTNELQKCAELKLGPGKTLLSRC
jgi:hypothetical protein